MIVLKASYDSMKSRAIHAEASYWRLLKKHNELVENWNDLVANVNDRGGEAFLKPSPTAERLSEQDIRALIQLCHPDKHHGKPMAVEMTQKLLKLKEVKK